MFVIIVSFAEAVSYYALAITGVLWLILAIFGGTLVDQAVTISNFVTSIILLICAIGNIINLFNSREKKSYKILGTVELAILIGAGIYGAIIPYTNMMFKYSYVTWASIVQTTWIPALLINIINSYIEEHEIKETIVSTLSIMVLGFCIGQILTIGLWLFTGVDNTKNLYSNITYYENKNIEANNFSDLDAMNKALDDFKETLKQKNIDVTVSSNITSEILATKTFANDYVSKYGLEMIKVTRLLNNNMKYRVSNKRTSEATTFFFDATENKFTEYDKEKVIAKEKVEAEQLKSKFENYAIEIIRKDLGYYEAGDYFKNTEPELSKNFNVTQGSNAEDGELQKEIKFTSGDKDMYFLFRFSGKTLIYTDVHLNETIYN